MLCSPHELVVASHLHCTLAAKSGVYAQVLSEMFLAFVLCVARKFIEELEQWQLSWRRSGSPLPAATC